MTSDELRSLLIGKTEYEATSQNNIIYEALAYARMVNAQTVQHVGDNPAGGVIPELCDGKRENDRKSFDRDKPIPFRLEDFILHIDKVQGRKKDKTETDNIAPSDSHRKRIDDILRKVSILRSNPQLQFILNEYNNDQSPSLAQIIAQLIGSNSVIKNTAFKIIDISGLPNEVAGLLTALISRLIFQYKLQQNRDQREKDPVLLVCEKAHRYVPNQGEAQYKDAQTAIRRIAREGR